MGRYLEQEKRHQSLFREASDYFAEAARAEGLYRGKFRPFCLPVDCAEENLFSEIRAEALVYFEQNKIKWHDGIAAKPSNHLCSSQVQCVNFLFPFADKPEALCTLLRPFFPDIQSIEPMEGKCSELRGSEQLAACGEGIQSSGAPGTEEGSESHLGVGALG